MPVTFWFFIYKLYKKLDRIRGLSDGATKLDRNSNLSPISMYQVRGRHTKSWSEEDMRHAITMITAGGWDIRRTAETYNIPLRTLYYHLKKVRKEKVAITNSSEMFCVQWSTDLLTDAINLLTVWHFHLLKVLNPIQWIYCIRIANWIGRCLRKI